MQDVLLAFANGSYDSQKGRFHKWLLTVILNKVRDCWSQRQRCPQPVGGTDFQLELQEVPDDVEDDWDEPLAARPLNLSKTPSWKACGRAAHRGTFPAVLLDFHIRHAIIPKVQND